MEGYYLGQILFENRFMYLKNSPFLNTNFGNFGNYGNVGNYGNPGNYGSVGIVGGYVDVDENKLK